MEPLKIIGEPSLWARFGLPGLVIFALFATLALVIWLSLKHLDKMDDRNVNAYKEMANRHREERDHWTENSNRQIDKFESAITRLADGIRDTKKN